MRTLIAALAIALVPISTLAADSYVNGYTRQDGTYVSPYHRTTPDNKLYNNYSSQGQINPYTGQQGTHRNELSNPPAYPKSNPYYTPNPYSQPNPYATPGYRPYDPYAH